MLLGSIGLDRNHTFIVAAYNRLPARGGGEPTPAEIRAPVGDYEDSTALLRDTVVATGPRLVVALGNVALRTLAAALTGTASLPGLRRLEDAGFARGTYVPAETLGLAPSLRSAWGEAWHEDPLPALLWLTHPSGQNMSPFAGTDTQFHQRMLSARDHVRRAARDVLGTAPPRRRAHPAATGIYALPEWREGIASRHDRLDTLWRERGV